MSRPIQVDHPIEVPISWKPATDLERARCVEWLHELLSRGSRSLRDLQDEAWAAGFLWPEVMRAARMLNVRQIQFGADRHKKPIFKWSLIDGSRAPDEHITVSVPEWLEEFLLSGRRTIPEIRAAAEDAGISWTAVGEAARKIGVKLIRVNYWELLPAKGEHHGTDLSAHASQGRLDFNQAVQRRINWHGANNLVKKGTCENARSEAGDQRQMERLESPDADSTLKEITR